MFGTTERNRRSTSEESSHPVRVVIPPRVLHARLQRLAGAAAPASRLTRRERFLLRVREPRGQRSIAILAVATLPLMVSLVLLLLGVPGDASLSW